MEEAFQSDYKKRGARWAGAVSIPPLPKDALVLETGCGNGKTLSAFSCRAVGVDISLEAVRLAGAKNAVAGDVRALPFSDSVFDAVFCWHVLGHLMEADRIKAVSELFRVTKPSGSVYFKAFLHLISGSGKALKLSRILFLEVTVCLLIISLLKRFSLFLEMARFLRITGQCAYAVWSIPARKLSVFFQKTDSNRYTKPPIKYL